MQSIIKANYSLYLGFSRPANWRGLPREKQTWSLSQHTFTTLLKSKTTPRSDLHTQTQHIYNVGNLANCLSYVSSKPTVLFNHNYVSISLWMQYKLLWALGPFYSIVCVHVSLLLWFLCLSLKPTVLFNHAHLSLWKQPRGVDELKLRKSTLQTAIVLLKSVWTAHNVGNTFTTQAKNATLSTNLTNVQVNKQQTTTDKW